MDDIQTLRKTCNKELKNTVHLFADKILKKSKNYNDALKIIRNLRFETHDEYDVQLLNLASSEISSMAFNQEIAKEV